LPAVKARRIQARARALDARVLVSGITTLDDVVATEMAPWRFSAWVFGLFAVLAIGLASLGLFSAVSLDVTSRQRGFAIRLAVGASHRQIVAAARAGAGIGAGVAVALVATRAVQGLLFGVTLTDGATYAAVIGLVAAVVAVAAYVPARRAAGTTPVTLLRRGRTQQERSGQRRRWESQDVSSYQLDLHAEGRSTTVDSWPRQPSHGSRAGACLNGRTSLVVAGR